MITMVARRHTRVAIAMRLKKSGANDARDPTTNISSFWRLRCGVHGVFPKSGVGFLLICATAGRVRGKNATGNDEVGGVAPGCESVTGEAQWRLRTG